MMKKILFTYLILFISILNLSNDASAQTNSYKCYPSHWWTGMKWNKVQIMVHSENEINVWADKSTVQINYPGVKLVKIHKAENRKYIFLDLEIAPSAKPGKIKIDFVFIDPKDKTSIYYELKSRRSGLR